MCEANSVWLQDWQRPRTHRRFDLRTGRFVESKQLDTDAHSETSLGVCARCSSGFALVFRTTSGVWLQVGTKCVRMDNRRAIFSHERKLSGLMSELRVEPRGEVGGFTLRKFSVSRLLFDDEDFLAWVANSANDVTWVSWVTQRWQALEVNHPAFAGGSIPSSQSRESE